MTARGLVALAGALMLLAGCEEPVPCDLEFDAVFRYGDGSPWGDEGAIAGAGDVNGDGYGDIVIGEGMRRGQAGEAYLFFGPLDGEHSLEDADAVFVGASEYDRLGEAVSAAGDLDGDGIGDLLIAAPDATDDVEEQGIVYIFHGPIEPGEHSVAEAGATFRGREEEDHVGTSVAGAGDVDGDGVADIVVGATWARTDMGKTGAAYVLYGPVTADRDVENADGVLMGEHVTSKTGDAISPAGDLDGDGIHDVLVGAKFMDAVGTNGGAAYVQLGPIEGTTDLEEADLRMLGDQSDRAGSAVAGGGDLDGDGFDDIAVGAESGGQGGRVYVVSGPRAGTLDLDDADVVLAGTSYVEGTESIGQALAIPGDMNGDGLADLVVGAPGVWDVAYLLHGPVECSGVIAEECEATFLKGEEEAWTMGKLVAPAGDVNGDGYPDVLVAAPEDEHDESGIVWYGAVYLFYGGPCL